MSEASLIDRMGNPPPAANLDRVRFVWLDLEKACADLEDQAAREGLKTTLSDPKARMLLESVIGHSPYLTRLMLRYPGDLPTLLKASPNDAFDQLIGVIEGVSDVATGQKELMRVLRRTKQRAALLIALADIGEVWGVEEVTTALTRLADAALRASVRHLLVEAHQAGKLQLSDPKNPERDCGFTVLALGKHGAGELNYSSDIDLIVLFVSQALAFRDGVDESQFFIGLTKSLVKIMQEATGDGYVFRTDLRLRPDPASTQVALSMAAAEFYYESMGQNWERAAMIKARPAAGDIDAGTAYLERLSPFIWRKHLDFAAIEDIHSIKRQIDAYRGHGQIAITGHNIKLGRGGIREIEFFAQTQQLIAGGRDAELRDRATCPALDRLAEKNWITSEAAAELKEAYLYLRKLEHRLQMRNDEQTHTLPTEDDELAQVAAFMGCDETPTFAKDLRAQLETVQRHYAALFESEPTLAQDGGSLVFTGTEDDPETLETLANLGFAQPATVLSAVRGWHFGHVRATRSARSRQMLTKLTPRILSVIAGAGDPDLAFNRFSSFLSGLPGGVQLFSLLHANPTLLNLLIEILSTAPRLSDYLSRNAGVLDVVLDPGFLEALPTRDDLSARLTQALANTDGLEEALDASRKWAKEESFRIGVHVLSGKSGAGEAGPAYAALGDLLVAALLPVVEDELARRHGRVSGGGMAVIAMGKLGGEEMTSASDLDLIFVYNHQDTNATSDGPASLQAGLYFARLSQRLINALTAPTAEGKLYEVDMQLRPSGNAGPIATHIDRFIQYQKTESWTWETMALTRARVIAGTPELLEQLPQDIYEALTRARDPAVVAADVREMRARLEKEYATKDIWNLKYARGGLIDLEFICQYLQLVHAADHPDVLDRNTASAFQRMAECGVIDGEQAHKLLKATKLLHNLTQVLRIAVEGAFDPDTAPPGLRQVLARAADAPDIGVVTAQLVETQASVLALFDDLIPSA